MTVTGGDKFDGKLRIGQYRRSMEKNRRITDPRMDVGAQAPTHGPALPKCHTYGLIKVKGPYDSTAAVMHDWQTFDQEKQLQRHGNNTRKRHAMKVNMAALDAGITNAKPWNEFCMKATGEDYYYYLPEHTQKAFLARRAYKVPDRVERIREPSHEMNRIFAMDYAREWSLKKKAQADHDRAQRQIEERVMGQRYNADMAHRHEKYHAGQRRNMAVRQHLNSLVPLPHMTSPKRIRAAQTALATFRDDDKRKRLWQIPNHSLSNWESALGPERTKKSSIRI